MKNESRAVREMREDENAERNRRVELARLKRNTSRVFVCQEPRPSRKRDGTPYTVDLTPALDFGSLETLVRAGPQVADTGFLTRDLLVKLRDFSDKDYVLAIGDPVVIGLVCAIAAKMNGGRFTLLRWDRLEFRYYPIVVDLNQ